MWEITTDEINTIGIEITTIIAAIFVLLVVLFLKRGYSKYTEKGFTEFAVGVLFLTLHFFFDLLDTLAVDDSILYSISDILDAVFNFVGLFIIGYAFFRIAQYGKEGVK